MYKKYFEAQKEDEKVLYIIRRHWFTLFLPAAISSLMYLLAILGIFLLPHLDPSVVSGYSYNIYILSISLLFLFSTAYIYSAGVIYYLNVILITNENIVEIHQVRFFAREVSELGFEKIQDVASKENGVFQSLLDFGQIEIQTAGENRNFIFSNIPKPSEWVTKIMDLETGYSVGGNEAGHKKGFKKIETELSKNNGSDRIIKEQVTEKTE
ncbi:MAG: PH domain-containing protein [Patescibacteria group bacterium]|jgi:hypothetical protein|nr:PH domain-containing protein [Patescibacteria group bacterium]